METKRNTNYGVMYGLIGGLILCIVMLIQYLGGINLYLSPLVYLSYIVTLVIMVLAGLRQRKENGNQLTFAEALKVVFTTVVIATFMQTVFSYILLNFIDTSFRDALGQEIMNKSEEMLKKLGMSENEIDKALKQQQGDQFSIGKVFLGFAFTCIFNFVISLIIAAIIKRNKPVFNLEGEQSS